MKLHQLRDAIAVADHGSLRAASRQLSVSQSALTKSIQMLEKELETPLFERSKRGAILTPMGALFMRRARAATSELVRAREEIAQHRGDGHGKVTISMSMVPHMALLPPVVAPFAARYPNIRLTVVEGIDFTDVQAQLRSGAIDCFIGVSPTVVAHNEFHVERLFINPRWIVARAGHPLAQATSISQLIDEGWVLQSENYARTQFAALFERHGARVPHKITVASSIFGQMVFLLNSNLIAVSPRQVVEFAPMQGRLVRIPVRETVEAPAMVMIRRAALPLTPAAEHFCDLIRRASAQLL